MIDCNDNESVLVTILCITYNHESYIRQCLDGFVMQKTNFRFEAIVHDDASTDDTTAIVREYEEKYPDIIKAIYEAENQYSKRDGCTGQKIDAATRGKYIAVCEGDDYWIDPLKLQKQVDCLINNSDIALVFSNRIVLDEYSSKKVVQKYTKRYYSSEDLLGGEILGLQTVCYRRECLINRSDINGDILIPYTASGYGKLYCLPDITAVYRITGKGAATSRRPEQVLPISLQQMWDFHKAYNFPSKRLLIKAQTRYVFSDLANRIRRKNYALTTTMKSFLLFHNKTFLSQLYAFTLMNGYILYFIANYIYGKFKR